jgi:hydrogenase maturation protein HypF
LQEKCVLLKVTGIVQGVGFRPYVYNLAKTCRLKGRVYNDGEGVAIEVEGETGKIADFTSALLKNPPPLAHITDIISRRLGFKNYKDFVIEESISSSKGKMLLPPDTAICLVCRKELADPTDRHYLYPFTNCTSCGPRFTITHSLPYDRCRTSMDAFAMCPECFREYHDPEDRRFHAQHIACPSCGPEVYVTDEQGVLTGDGDWLITAVKLITEGEIVGIKGLGGFHLACDASNKAAVVELRLRKQRPAKPFALMCRDVETVEQHCFVSKAEAELLKSPAAPIVLLRRKPDSKLPSELAPGLDTLGVMLPYTPLHLLLLQEGPPVLVMTSGNKNGMPIITDNQQALRDLKGIARYFIKHNRDIVNRCDDSVTAVIDGQIQFLRRSRGYVPEPINVPVPEDSPAILGVGGEMKNTFCLLNEGKAYMSQHIGELDTLEDLQNFDKALDSLCNLTRIHPIIVVSDLHPGYMSSKLADQLTSKLGTIRHMKVQHHHAHLASCMAENNVNNESVIGIILDGTGFGLDGSIWGFEVMRGDYFKFEREFYLDYVPLPGGERSVRNPWLAAGSYLMTFLGLKAEYVASRFFPDRQDELITAEKMISAKFNSPPASSCGRLFDAVSALLGLCHENTYEGQAAVELGSLVFVRSVKPLY